MNRTRRDGIMGRIVLSVAADPLRYVIANIFSHLNREMRMYRACQGDSIVINQRIYDAVCGCTAKSSRSTHLDDTSP